MKKIYNIFLAVMLFTFTACGQSDTATVTIDTGIRRQAAVKPISLFDRLFALISFSTKAQADPPLDLPVDTITLSISGPGMEPMENIEIPIETGIITVDDVPAGSSRKFIVYGINTGEGSERTYGGNTTRNLSPGENAEIKIQMGRLPYYPNFWGFNEVEVGIGLEWNHDPFYPTTGFKVYRAPGNGSDRTGPFVLISAGPPGDYFNGQVYRYNDQGGDNNSWYIIAAYNAFGENYNLNQMPVSLSNW